MATELYCILLADFQKERSQTFGPYSDFVQAMELAECLIKETLNWEGDFWWEDGVVQWNDLDPDYMIQILTLEAV